MSICSVPTSYDTYTRMSHFTSIPKAIFPVFVTYWQFLVKRKIVCDCHAMCMCVYVLMLTCQTDG